jgi:hypothetical protein|tara:strand:- start:5242 stop:5718 length:477 start_codon:yes stop_codon:yes gene_type:complete
MNNITIKTSITAFVTAFIISFALTSCENDPSKKIKSENVDKSQERINTVFEYPTIKFDKTNHDFGEIRDGDVVETVFTFTNSGDSDLKILNASGSCGCTVPEYPRDTPIRPGESSVIKVKFDSSNKPGMQRKTVTLVTNTSKGKEMLNIKAFVLPKNN